MSGGAPRPKRRKTGMAAAQFRGEGQTSGETRENPERLGIGIGGTGALVRRRPNRTQGGRTQ